MKRGVAKLARGSEHRGQLRCVVSFDEETFGQVRDVAAARGISFGEAIRQLVEFGLLDMAEAA